jgi:hypothetical protein
MIPLKTHRFPNRITLRLGQVIALQHLLISALLPEAQ